MTADPHAPEQPGVDLRQVLAEIHEDVRRRRAGGDIPPGFERELDAVFARFAPAAAVGGDLESVLERAERSSFIDVDVPTASNVKGVEPVKRGLRKAMSWYLRYLAQQTSAFAAVTTRGLRLLADRVEALEDATPGASPRVHEELERLEPSVDPAGWADLAVERLAGATGRVLHAEAGAGALLTALVAAGIDAYGVEPRRHLADQAVAGGHDVRPDGALAHLRTLPPGALGGLVLSGCVDRLPLSSLLELADLAGSRLAAGGVLVIVGATPNGWADAAPVEESDLAPGRPLHAATWQRLLVERGFGSVEVATGAAGAGLVPVPGDGDVAAALNANLERLGARLFGPAEHAVSAVRGS